MSWDDFCCRWIRCDRCGRRSPVLADPDAAVTWTETHPCETRSFA